MLCMYEDFVTRPEEVMRRIYKHVGVEYPRWSITFEVDRQSLGLGRTVEISNDVAALCTGLAERLDRCYQRNVDTPITNFAVDSVR